MKTNLYAIYDQKAATFTQPMCMQNDALAARAFSTAIMNPEHDFAKHPADFTLMFIGEYNDETGELENALNRSIGNGLEFKARLRSQNLEIPFDATGTEE